MKLQACSKIITLTALGFTLTAAGAFYALNQAQQHLMASYQQNLEQHLDSVGADLQHYVQRINGDYYQLINQSIAEQYPVLRPELLPKRSPSGLL